MEQTWLYIFAFGLKLVHVGVPTFVCNREVLNRDFSADSGIQVSECLRCASFNTVDQGRSCFFSLKLLISNYKLNVFGSFLVHPDLKDFKSLFIIGELFGSIINLLKFKLTAREVSAAT